MTLIYFYDIIEVRCSLKDWITMTIEKTEPLLTAGQIKLLLEEQGGTLPAAISFGNGPPLFDKETRIISLSIAEPDLPGSPPENTFVIDISNELFLEIQRLASQAYLMNVLGLSPEHRGLQKLMRKHSFPRGRLSKICLEFARSFDYEVEVCAMNDFQGLKHLFSSGQDEPIYIGPLYSPETKRVFFVQSSATLDEDHAGNLLLVFSLPTAAIDAITGEWRHALTSGQYDYPPAPSSLTAFWEAT